MGKRSREHRQAVIDGREEPIRKVESVIKKALGNDIIGNLKNPYQTLKDTLTNSKTPESAKNDFKVRTLNQLKIEALSYQAKYGDKEIAYKELLNVITSDKQYMDILSVVGIDSEFISKQIRADLGLS